MTVTPPYVIPSGIYTAADAYHLLGIDKKTLVAATNEVRIMSRPTSPVSYTGEAIFRFWCKCKQVKFTHEYFKQYSLTDNELRQLSIRTACKIRSKSGSRRVQS